MRILLFGDYSNVHWTLSQGLKALGHEVTVVSDGDSWKNYPRDINLKRESLGRWDTIKYLTNIFRNLHRFRGYDIVQLINPIFLDLRAANIRPFYEFLKRNNRSVILCAYGMDHYWVKTCLDCTTFRYSDFNLGISKRDKEPYNQAFIHDWLNGEKTEINKYIAKDSKAIVTGLYEYDCCYRPSYPNKTHFIPFPINMSEITPKDETPHDKVKFFVGMMKGRVEYKGLDIMYRALERVKSEFPDKCEIIRVESVPYAEYQCLMDSSDIILDQLYSYTPAMNALLAMAKGLIVVGGGEEENYEILHEQELRPIINVLPDEDDCYRKMKNLVIHKELIPLLSSQSREYIRRHHDHIKIAQAYSRLYTSLHI